MILKRDRDFFEGEDRGLTVARLGLLTWVPLDLITKSATWLSRFKRTHASTVLSHVGILSLSQLYYSCLVFSRYVCR